MAVYISGLLVFFARNEDSDLHSLFMPVCYGPCICVAAYILSFYMFHVFRGLLRYSSFVDLYRLALSGAVASFIILVLHQVGLYFGLSKYVLILRVASTILIYMSATMFMWCMRIFVKYLHDISRSTDKAEKTFIYGCLSGGIALAKSIRTETPARYQLEGFISGNQDIEKSWLLGVKVYYDDDSIVKVMKEKGVTVLLVSPLQSQRFTKRTSLIDALVDADIRIMMMPIAEEWDGASDLSHTHLKKVEVEDLLPREAIKVDMDAIGNMLRGKSIFITGAAGSIGAEIPRQVALAKIQICIGLIVGIDIKDILPSRFDSFGRYGNDFEDKGLDSARLFQRKSGNGNFSEQVLAEVVYECCQEKKSCVLLHERFWQIIPSKSRCSFHRTPILLHLFDCSIPQLSGRKRETTDKVIGEILYATTTAEVNAQQGPDYFSVLITELFAPQTKRRIDC